MSLKYALLTALHEKPATGYELNQHFRERLGYVWNATHQQIYRELRRLYEEELLLMEHIPQSERPDQKRYRVTETGVARLREWLATPQPLQATRDPFLVKLFAGDLVDDATLVDELESLRDHWQEQLAAYRYIEATYFHTPSEIPRHYRLQYVALRRGILDTEARLTWAEELAGEMGRRSS